jgi:ferredoxin
MSIEENQFTITFSPESHSAVKLGRGSVLSEHLTLDNSPVLFGCRTGICATCLVEVLSQENGELAAPSDDEKELLDIVAPDDAKARLACQIELSADIRIHYLGK